MHRALFLDSGSTDMVCTAAHATQRMGPPVSQSVCCSAQLGRHRKHRLQHGATQLHAALRRPALHRRGPRVALLSLEHGWHGGRWWFARYSACNGFK